MGTYRYAIGEYLTRHDAENALDAKFASGELTHGKLPKIEAGFGAWPFVITIEANDRKPEVQPYPSGALTDIAKQLLDDFGLTLAQIKNFAADLPGECEAIEENRSEAYWTERSAPDDSAYRRDMINAGRGELLP